MLDYAMEPTNQMPLQVGRVTAPKQYAEFAILVLDGSGSMMDPAVGNISKADAVNQACRNLFTRFRVSGVAGNFTFSVITFDDHPERRLEPTSATVVDDNGDYNPLHGHGSGTNIYAALELAEQQAKEFLSQEQPGGLPHGVVIVVMSDGMCSDPARTQSVADRIKKGSNGARIKLATAFFATLGQNDPAGEQLLHSLASHPMLAKTVYDAETLRGFFTASISTASGAGRLK
jgi:Mg-chelatase subunit ChlD